MKQNILVNLPEGFFKTEQLIPVFARLYSLGEVRKTSFNTSEEIKNDLAWADAVIMWSWPGLNNELLDNSPNLKFRGHIDITQNDAKIALNRDASISLSRGAWSPAVAEMGLTLILNTLRKVSDFHMLMKQNKEVWLKDIPADIDPDERQLEGKSVGIIGFGKIGRRLNELIRPFNCKIKIFDPYISQRIADDFGVEKCKLNVLIANSDIIILAAANNSGTKHLIGKNEIGLMKKSSILINISRAALIDTDALIKRLKTEEIYAAIDVFDKEPLSNNSILRNLKNAYLTPHKAGGIISSVERSISWLIDDYEATLNNNDLKYPLTEKMLSGLDG